MTYYIENNNEIVLVDTDLDRLQNTILFKPELEGLEIKETERSIIIDIDESKYVFADNEDYLARKAAKESERIAALSMTRGDFFRGIFRATGIKREALRFMIESATLDGFTEDDRELALIDFDEGLNFNRGNELVELLCSNSDITSDQMTQFFETGDYTELTATEEQAENEDSTEESSEMSNG